MKNLFLFCLIAVLLTVSVTAIKKRNLASSKHISLAKYNLNDILALVQTRIKEKGPLSDIYNFLKNFQNELYQQQTDSDDAHSKAMEQCEETLAFRQQEINDANVSIARSVDQYNKCTVSLHRAESNHEDLTRTLTATKEELEQVSAERESQREEFARKKEEHEETIAVLEEAIELFENLSGVVSFVQLQKTSLRLLKSAVRTRRTDLFAPVMAVLAQLSAFPEHTDYSIKTDYQAKATQAGSLLAQLRERTEDSLQEFTDVDRSAEENFQTLAAQLRGEISDMEAEIDTLESQISDMNHCIQTEESITSEAIAKLERNSDLLQHEEDSCRDADEEYKTGTEIRDNQVIIVKQVEGIIQDNIGHMSSDIQEIADQNKEDWQKYENPFHLDDYPALTYSDIVDNEEGADLAASGDEANDEIVAVPRMALRTTPPPPEKSR